MNDWENDSQRKRKRERNSWNRKRKGMSVESIKKMKNYKRGKKFDNKDPIVTNHQVNLSNLIFLDKWQKLQHTQPRLNCFPSPSVRDAGRRCPFDVEKMRLKFYARVPLQSDVPCRNRFTSFKNCRRFVFVKYGGKMLLRQFNYRQTLACADAQPRDQCPQHLRTLSLTVWGLFIWWFLKILSRIFFFFLL